MSTSYLAKQIKACIRLGIDSFSGVDGDHNLLCPACECFGDLQKAGHLLCPNEECRVGRFFTG